jgi:hypothetical protein
MVCDCSDISGNSWWNQYDRTQAGRPCGRGLVIDGPATSSQPLEAEGEGYFSGLVKNARVGMRYRYRLNGEAAFLKSGYRKCAAINSPCFTSAEFRRGFPINASDFCDITPKV